MKSIIVFMMLLCWIDGGLTLSQPRGLMVPKTAVRAFGFTAIWNRNYGATSYEVHILKDYSMEVIKTIKDLKHNRVMIRGLKPGGLYGVQVIAMDRNNQRSPPSKPVRIRTLKEPVVVHPTRAYMLNIPIGSCGAGKFTCGDQSCVEGNVWCDGSFDCDDRTDEKDCPGSCPKLNLETFSKGNYSCTRFESPQSVCSFTCHEGYVRDGPFYVRCRTENATWAGEVPTCRLQAPGRVKSLPDLTERHSIKLTWDRVKGAIGYKVARVQTRGKDEKEFKDVPIGDLFTKVVDKPHKLLAKVKTLERGTSYNIQIAAVDENDEEGFPSIGVIAETHDRDHQKH